MKITKLNFILILVLIQFSCTKRDELCETVSLATPKIITNSPVPIGTNIQLSVQPITGAGYFWSRSSYGDNNVSSISIPTFGYSDSGTIYFQYTTENGCESDFVSAKIVMIDPVAPCTLSANEIRFSNSAFTDTVFTSADTGCYQGDDYRIYAFFPGGGVYVYFPNCMTPKTGAYNIINYSPYYAGEAEVIVDANFTDWQNTNTGLLYLTNNNGNIKVEFCDLLMTNNFDTDTVSVSCSFTNY